MKQVSIKTISGSAAFMLPDPGDFDSFYVFAMHKSGSTLLNNMLEEVLTFIGIPHIAISEVAFKAGLPENDILNPEDFIFEKGYCYRGYRSFPGYLCRFDLSEKKKVLLIRDPRDMAVSNYFSYAQSHSLPESGPAREELLASRAAAKSTDINDFCMTDIKTFIDEFEGYEHLLNSGTVVYRYEDVIFRKEAWLNDMLSYFGIVADPALVADVAKQNDVIPQAERPEQHIRQVFPGNFRKHLNDNTIRTLNARLEPILEKFGYAKG